MHGYSWMHSRLWISMNQWGMYRRTRRCTMKDSDAQSRGKRDRVGPQRACSFRHNLRRRVAPRSLPCLPAAPMALTRNQTGWFGGGCLSNDPWNIPVAFPLVF